MNLINDAWLPVIRASGKKEPIAPWQIAERNDPVIELNAPRPDFQGALYQFLIGLLQTSFAPADHDVWLEYWGEPPVGKALQAQLRTIEDAFIFKGNAILPALPVFMQEANLVDGETKPIAALLIEAPGGKTIRENLDHFIKRDCVGKLCYSCAATALFTLQTNAPSGGVGHRVGLRGGGPLTTLITPTENASLWQKLWLNVLDAESLVSRVDQPAAGVFPWMGLTRWSDKNGVETRPENTHPLQVYWGMPRRIKLNYRSETTGTCDLCGEENTALIKEYTTRNYGVNYVGEWVHPLTPYWFDPKKEKPPLSIKGQKGGLGYRHWLGFVLAKSDIGDRAAKVTRAFMEERAFDIGEQRRARLWCFGYDMDNMKARCWYDHVLPLFQLNPIQRDNVLAWIGDLISAAGEVADNLGCQVKAAWFSRPADVKGDVINMNTIIQEFWQHSEGKFYKLLERITALPGNQRLVPSEIYAEWVKELQAMAYSLFDTWALESPAEDLNMRRIIAARRGLTKKMNSSKQMKALFAKANMGKGVTNAASTSVSLP